MFPLPLLEKSNQRRNLGKKKPFWMTEKEVSSWSTRYSICFFQFKMSFKLKGFRLVEEQITRYTFITTQMYLKEAGIDTSGGIQILDDGLRGVLSDEKKPEQFSTSQDIIVVVVAYNFYAIFIGFI